MKKDTYEVKNTGAISLEQLAKLKEQGVTNITVCNLDRNQRSTTYTIDDFISIKEKIKLEYIDGLPKIPDEDPDKEKKLFTYLYIKMAQNIQYDYFASELASATGYARDMGEKFVERASSLIGGVIDGKSLCGGYSEILRNLMSEIGIDASVITGGGWTKKDNMPSHAWNQVKLDGRWYNCDITNDADFILAGLKLPFYLKSNEQFMRYEQYPCKNPEMVKAAECTVTDEQQEEIIEGQRAIISKQQQVMQEYMGIKGDVDNKPFLSRLKSLFKRSLNGKLRDGGIR